MSQAIAGVTPAQTAERTAMIVWPGLTALDAPLVGRVGCTLGRLYSIRLGIGNILTLGNIIALLSIPLVLPPYFLMLIPKVPFVVFGITNPVCRRYRITNRRIIVEHGMNGTEQRSVALDRFDEIDVEIQPGQAWYPAGDLIFRKGNVETFRLLGLTRPETFRQACLKAHQAYVSVKQAIA